MLIKGNSKIISDFTQACKPGIFSIYEFYKRLKVWNNASKIHKPKLKQVVKKVQFNISSLIYYTFIKTKHIQQDSLVSKWEKNN